MNSILVIQFTGSTDLSSRDRLLYGYFYNNNNKYCDLNIKPYVINRRELLKTWKSVLTNFKLEIVL